MRCIKSLAPIAGRRLKFPSSQTVKDPFTAGTAFQRYADKNPGSTHQLQHIRPGRISDSDKISVKTGKNKPTKTLGILPADPDSRFGRRIDLSKL